MVYIREAGSKLLSYRRDALTSIVSGGSFTWRLAAAALALCLLTPGAGALELAFDHYFKGLTPNADGVYVVEPGAVLEYRAALDLANTKATTGTGTFDVWWSGAAASLVFSVGSNSMGDFATALPGTRDANVVLRKLLNTPKSGGLEFFRVLAWSSATFFGIHRYQAGVSVGNRGADGVLATAALSLSVSKTASATLIRPVGDDVRLERPSGDQVVLFGISIPSVNSTRTNGVEMAGTLSFGSHAWLGSGGEEFAPPTTVISPDPIRIRFAERENDVDVAVVGSNFQTLTLSTIGGNLNTGSTMAAPSAIMHFQITDGADGFPAIVEGFNISVVSPSVSEISDAQLEAFTYYLQRADDPSQTWPLTLDTANNRLTAETITEAAPLVVGGSTQSVTVNFVVYAYQHDTSVRIIDGATFRLIFQNLLSTHFVLSENGSGLRHGNEDLARGGINTGGYNVGMNVVGTQWHQTGVGGGFPGDGDGVVYLVDSAEYPNMVLSGEWRDAHGNVDGNYQATDLIATFTNMDDSSVVGEATLTLTYSEFAGGDKVVQISTNALRGVTATHALNLTNSFAGALRILEAKTDSGTDADGSQWTVTVRDGADGAQSAPFAFTVQIQAHSAALEPNSLRLDKPFSHGVASRLTYQLNFIAIDGLQDRQTPSGQGIVAGCNACPGFDPGSPSGSIDHSGMTLIPLLNSGDFHASAADRTVAFSTFVPGGGLPAITAPTAADLAADSPVQDFVILPPPVSTLTVSVSDGSGSNLNTDGSYTRMVDITIVRTDPDRSDDRYTKATFSVSQLDVVLGQDRSSVRLQDVEVSLHTASSAPAARTSGNGATESVSLRPSAYNISPGSTNTGPTLRLRYIDPTGVDESIGTISVNSMAFTLTQNPPAAANVVIVDQVGLTQGDGVDNIRALNIAVDATKVVGAELETSAGCRHDPANKTFASGDTLTCIERARLRVKTQVQYQDANNNVDTAARSHSWHLVDLTADPNTEQELVAATAGDVGRVPMRAAFDGKADKSRFRLEARSAGLTPFTLPFTLDFENSGATFASANLAFGGDLRHQASALVTVPGIALTNTYTNTHNTDANKVIVVVRAECATTVGGMTAEGCDGAASMFSGPSGIANDGDGAFKATFGMQAPTDGSMLNIGNLSITPSVDLSALQSISATDAMLSMALRVYRDSDGDGILDAADILMGKIDSMKVSVQGQAAELSYSVSAADDRSLDSVDNVGMANLKKIADITIEDGGTDTLSGRITGISVANAPANLTFALTPENSMEALEYPLTVANGASVRLNLYAYIDDASSITDNTEAAVTLDVQAAASSNGGVDLHSTAASDTPAISVFYIVVGTQLAGQILNGFNERGGTRYFDVQTGAESLRVMLALEDTHGNRDLDLYNEMDHFRFALTGSEADLPAEIYDTDFYEGSTLPLLLVATQSFSIDAEGLSSADISVEDMNQAEMFHAVGANIKDVSDGAELRFLVWHSRLSDKVQNFGEQFTLNYIADAAETVDVPTHAPDPISSERSVTIRDAGIRAYNTWSGQTDLDASLVSADISQAIMDGLSCAVPLRDSAGFNTSCAARDVENATLADADGDGVWTFANAPSFRPANTGGGTLQGTAGTLDLAPELSWRIDGLPAASFTSSATLLSGAAYRAYQPQTFGLLQTIYTSTEGADPHQTVCVAQVAGMAQPALGDVVATIATQAGDAEEGVDYTAVSSSLNFNRATIENCWNIPITDDDMPENDETFTVNISLAWANPESSEAPLTINPAQARVTIISDDKIRVRVEAGRLDDGGDFVAASTPVVTEESFEGEGPDDPLLLRFSFWTDETNPQPFTDNLGGRRLIGMSLNKNTDSAQWHNLNSDCADANFESFAGDGCLAAHEGNADVVLSLTSAADGSGFSRSARMRYDRNGRREFYVEVWARIEGEIEAEEILTIDPTTLFAEDESVTEDNNYIPDPRNTTFTVRVTDGEAPEVRYFSTATGERVNEITAFEESTLSYRVGIYDKNTGEALALKEAFSFGLGVIGDPLSVVKWAAGAGVAVDASVITFTFAAGAAADLTFSIFAFDDTGSVSEQGGLQYSHGSGAMNIEHPASLALTVVDNDDGISPSACVGAVDNPADLPATDDARDAAQADCLRVASAGAFGFSLEWDEARDRQDVDATALMALANDDRYRIYLVEQAAGACPAPPDRPPLRQTAAGLEGDAVPVSGAYPAGYDLAVDAVATLEITIDRARDTNGDRVAIKADTRYCAILRVSDSAWVDWAPQPVVVRTVAYSTADADGNGVPDHLDPDGTYTDLDAYLSAQCAGTSLVDYDCDGDDVPDALELRFGRAADVSISPMALNCRANGLRTRLAADLPSLTCSGATTALDAISDQTLVHATDNEVPAAEPGGVAVSIADPDMLGEEMFLPGRYWLSGDTIDSVVNLGLERAVEISAPEVTALDADLIVRGRGLGAKLTPSLQQITARLSHSTPVETIQASGFLHISDPPQIGAVVTGATNFSASQLSPLFSRPEVTELLLRMTWTDEVGDGVLQQRILISRPGTTPTLFVPSSEAGMLSIAGGGTFLDDGVLTLAEESSGQTLAVSVDSRPSVSADRWTLTVAGADPTMAPLYFTDSTDTRRAGLTLNQASLDLPLAFLLSLDLTLPARLLISWSGEESGADHGAHAVVLIFAPGSTPTAAAKTALLDGYRLGGHYRDGETPREVRPGPGAKIRLGDYAAQRCLQEPDVCSGREELPDRGLGLNAAGDARHPACPRLGAAALPCLDFQLFCDASADECMSGGAVDVVFPLNAPLRADHWLYYSQPRALDGAGRTCPFVQTGMPAHVAAQASRYAQDRCPGVDVSATPPAFRAEPIYPDRIYAAPDSDASACPPIGDTSWRSLAEMQDSGADLSTVNCLRVAYSDGGPNDSAPNEAALIADPMGVGAPGAAADGFDPLAGNFGSGGGGGALGVFALLALALLALISLPLRSTPISPRRGEKRQSSRRLKLPQRGGRATTLPILLALTLGVAPQARAADWKVFDDIGDFFGEVFSGDFFAEGAWATGLDLALSGFDRDISGVQEDADDNDYGFRLRGHWDQDGVWGEGLAAEVWWADLGSAALRPDGGGEEVDFDYEAYGLGLTWGWALPRFDWLSIGGFDLNPNHVFAGGGWRDIDVADADGDGAYFSTGLSWNVGEWFNAPAEEWSLRVSYDVFDSEGVDYFAIGLTHRFGAAPTRALPTARPTDARKRLSRRARRGALASCGEWDSCACQRPINANARGWYVQVATYSDNGLAVARKRMRQLREAGYREVGLRDNGRGLHALRVSVRGDCREAEALKGRLDALLNVDSMLRGWKDRPY